MESYNLYINGGSEFLNSESYETEVANQKVQQLLSQNQQNGMVLDLLDKEPLGLKISITPTFLDRLSSQMDQSASTSSPNFTTNTYHKDVQLTHNKAKATTIEALSLNIGLWEKVAEHRGVLVAKFYFLRKKLLWEILECGLKMKIEVHWSDILGMRAFTGGNENDILEIELKKAPELFRETNQRPKKHTCWASSLDFTGGHASNYRRHCIKFPPGKLLKPYQDLLDCDERFKKLIQNPFPRLVSPYFYPDTHNGNGLQIKSVLNLPQYTSIPMPLSSIQCNKTYQTVISQSMDSNDSYSPTVPDMGFAEVSNGLSFDEGAESSDMSNNFEANNYMIAGGDNQVVTQEDQIAIINGEVIFLNPNGQFNTEVSNYTNNIGPQIVGVQYNSQHLTLASEIAQVGTMERPQSLPMINYSQYQPSDQNRTTDDFEAFVQSGIHLPFDI